MDTSVAEVRQRVAAAAGLTPEALHELLPSGKVTKFANRVGWALVHLQRAGLVEKVQRGIVTNKSFVRLAGLWVCTGATWGRQT